ncbi:MAG: hypothetical protein Q7T57_08055 [Dehalococcoidales bacterium]|nr:hypothetical protein [Dehalococcoidales bacterium]
MKTLGIVLLSFLLFILLSVFGLAFTINQIALTPGFITGVIHDIDFSETTRDMLEQQELTSDKPLSSELVDIIIDTLDKIEPVLKENINIAVRDTYDYVLGKANAPNLKDTLGDSFMNAQFVDSVLEKIDLSQIVDEVMKEQTQSSGEPEDTLQKSLLATIDKLEPTIKKQAVAASDPIFRYVLGETQTIDLKSITRQKVLNKEFMTEMIDAIDIKTITKDMIGDQLDMELPQGIKLSSGEVDQIIVAIEPALKIGMTSAAEPIADYLLGIRSSFSVTISLDTAMTSAKSVVKQAFLRQLPPELAGATPAQIDQAFDVYWPTARSNMPTSFVLDSSTFGESVSESFTKMLDNAQEGLAEMRNSIDEASISLKEALDEVKPYIRIFQMAYWGLIILILLVIGGIILIHRSVRGATRDLGINFVLYGAIGLVVVLIIKSIVGSPEFIQNFIKGDVPDYALNIISPVIQRLTQPLFTFTLACTIIGVALLVVSFVYPKREPTVETNQPPQSP